LLITNQRADRQIRLVGRGFNEATRAIDASGAEYVTARQRLGREEGGSVSTMLIQGVRTQAENSVREHRRGCETPFGARHRCRFRRPLPSPVVQRTGGAVTR